MARRFFQLNDEGAKPYLDIQAKNEALTRQVREARAARGGGRQRGTPVPAAPDPEPEDEAQED